MVIIWVLVAAVLFGGLGYLLGRKRGKVDGYDLGYADAFRGERKAGKASDTTSAQGSSKHLTSELLSIIYQYVEGIKSLKQLEDWLVPRLPLLFHLPPSDPEATELAALIEGGLAELSRGDRSEEEFRALLRSLISRVKQGAIWVKPPT